MNNNKILKTTGIILTLVIPTYVLYLWFTIQSQYFSFGNNSWLMIAAERMLAGQSLVEHIYESNPPLSIIIYIPHILFSWLMGMPPPIAGFYATTSEIGLSLIFSTLVIRKFDFLSFNQKLLFLISFLIAFTISAGIFISEREHLIFIWMIPFVLCQFAITEKIKLPSVLYIPILIIGSVMLLVKPHYGIIPASLFLIRMIHHRKFFLIIKDIDFLILSITTLLYATSLFTISNYGTVILPDVIRLYGFPAPFPTVLNIIIGYISISLPLLLFEIAMGDIKDSQKRFLNLFHICLFLSFIPYFVQMKGFPNHIIPIYGFFIISLSASLILRLDRLPKKIESLAPAICASGILFFVLNHSPLSTKTMMHKDVKNLEALQYLEKNCEQPCTYFAFHSDVEIFNPISAYTNMINGTRYVTYWWLKQVYFQSHDNNEDIRKNIQPIKEKHFNFVIEDFKFYKPNLLLIAKDMPLGNNHNLNFIEYFNENIEFKKIIEQHYTKIDDVSFEFKEYYKGTNFTGIKGGYKYNVYKRTSE